jgi:hypothetical protein
MSLSAPVLNHRIRLRLHSRAPELRIALIKAAKFKLRAWEVPNVSVRGLDVDRHELLTLCGAVGSSFTVKIRRSVVARCSRPQSLSANHVRVGADRYDSGATGTAGEQDNQTNRVAHDSLLVVNNFPA